MIRALLTAAALTSAPCLATDMAQVETAANALFQRLPDVVQVTEIEGQCGADAHVNKRAAYCTSENRIYVTQNATGAWDAGYLVAHLMGHAVQVQHGVADLALRAILQDRSREQDIRSVVVAQVECLAGLFVTRAGLVLEPSRLFVIEPFTGSHWGRNPLRIGPNVSVTAALRQNAFEDGQTSREVATCDAIGAELAPGLLTKAVR